MADAPRRAGGITMLDAAALVTGAAVASVHFRDLTGELAGLTVLGWLFVCIAFGWLALTSAGPFVFLVRRFSSRPVGYPTATDGLWVAFGLPWLFAALYRSGLGGAFDSTNRSYGNILFAGLFVASALALGWVARNWSKIDLDPSEPRKARSWTEIVGRIVSVTWPLQLGLGLVITH